MGKRGLTRRGLNLEDGGIFNIYKLHSSVICNLANKIMTLCY